MADFIRRCVRVLLLKRAQVAFGLATFAAFTSLSFLPAGKAATARSPARTGFTFSQQQTEYLNLPWQEAFLTAMELHPRVVRLAAYWDRIEAAQGSYDFSTLDWLIDHVPPGTQVALVVGMKAPRWPEFYLPSWLEQANLLPGGVDVATDSQLQAAALQFVQATVTHYQAVQAVTVWQVENEPLNPSGPRSWTIGPDFLSREVATVRAADPRHRPVMLTMFLPTDPLPNVPTWSRDLTARADILAEEGNIVGLDVYPARELELPGFSSFVRWPAYAWQPQVRRLIDRLHSRGRAVWVTEVQAEPWLITELVYLGETPSPEITPGESQFLLDQLEADGVNTALFWGEEYWQMRSQKFGDARWWNQLGSIVAAGGAGR